MTQKYQCQTLHQNRMHQRYLIPVHQHVQEIIGVHVLRPQRPKQLHQGVSNCAVDKGCPIVSRKLFHKFRKTRQNELSDLFQKLCMLCKPRRPRQIDQMIHIDLVAAAVHNRSRFIPEIISGCFKIFHHFMEIFFQTDFSQINFRFPVIAINLVLNPAGNLQTVLALSGMRLKALLQGVLIQAIQQRTAALQHLRNHVVSLVAAADPVAEHIIKQLFLQPVQIVFVPVHAAHNRIVIGCNRLIRRPDNIVLMPVARLLLFFVALSAVY